MAKLPSRKELADKLDQLERDLAIFTLGTGSGAVLARSPGARAAAGRGAARFGPAGLLADLAIREEESIAYRAGDMTIDQLMRLARGAEMRQREMGVTPIAPVIAPTVPVTKKTPSKFNKAISAGMKKVKASSSYGKKGTISNAKKAFTAVTKTVSGLGRRKMPAKGIKRAIASTPAAKRYKDEILRRKK